MCVGERETERQRNREAERGYRYKSKIKGMLLGMYILAASG